MRGFGVLRFDFRGVGFARTGREIVGRVYKMMLLREFATCSSLSGFTAERGDGFPLDAMASIVPPAADTFVIDVFRVILLLLPHAIVFCIIWPSMMQKRRAMRQ